jgi:hypothetical protein
LTSSWRRLNVTLDSALVERALAEATRRTENLEYFFDQLKSPEWIEPLRERGYFRRPPKQRIDEEGLVRAPGWSESRYLARVAAGAPDAVLDIFRSIDTNNERVLEDLIDAALVMPTAKAVEASRVVRQWIGQRDHIYYLLPRKAVELICQLAATAPGDAADLLRVLLEPLPAKREHDWLDSPTARVSDWEYDLHLRKVVETAVPLAPTEFLAALVDLVRRALTLLRESSETGEDDLSRVWRPRVNDDRDRAREVEESLTSAIRDASVQIRRDQLLSDRELVSILTAEGDELLRRIAMHALSRDPQPDLDVIRPFVLDEDELTKSEPSPEFQELLSLTAPLLEAAEVQPLIEAIETGGPDLDRFRETSAEFGKPATADDVEAYVAGWKIARFALIRDALPAKAWAEYEELVAKYGDATIPVSWELRTTYVGWKSPLSADEFAAKRDDELVEYLRDWTQEDDWGDAPSVEGLTRALAAAVQQDPERFSQLAPSFQRLPPAYVEWFVEGLQAALRDRRGFEWPPVLDLAAWIVDQPREIPGGRGDRYADLDPGWVWTRRRIVELLELGCGERDGRSIPFDKRARAWYVIAAIADDPDPTPEHEQRYGGQNMDPATLALNTTRPRALRAAIAYAIWVYDCTGGEAMRDGFVEEIAEVAELVRAHLDPDRDRSLSVRAVFGQSYPNLFALDNDWAAELASLIFPDEDSALREAAWGSFVVYTNPYNNVLDSLRDVYLRSAQLAGSEGHGFRWGESPAAKLGEHIATFLWRGVLSVDDDLFTVFWSNATAIARGHMVDFVGRSTREAPLSPELQERLQVLWNFAKVNVRAGEENETL